MKDKVKKNYGYNSRNWEKKYNVYMLGITIKEEDLSRKDLELVKKNLSNKGISMSNFVISKIKEYKDSMKGGN